MASNDIAYLSEVYVDTFIVFDSSENPVTGILNAAFPKVITRNGAYVATPVATVTEVDAGNAPGFYRLSITPDVVGDWHIRVSNVINNKAGWEIPFEVKRRESSVQMGAEYDTAGAILTILVAFFIENNKVLTATNCTVNLKDEDGTLLETKSDTSPDAEGIFKLEFTTVTVTAGVLYQCEIIVTDANSITYDHERILRAE